MKFCDVYTDKEYIESDGQHSIVQVSDKGNPCKWVGMNSKKQRVVKYRVDGGIITSKTELKCDYAVYVEDDSIYLIELKGANYNHALEQINATLDKLVIAPHIETSSVNGRVVLTKGRVPGIKYSKEPSIVKKLKKLNGTLESRTKLFEEKI